MEDFIIRESGFCSMNGSLMRSGFIPTCLVHDHDQAGLSRNDYVYMHVWPLYDEHVMIELTSMHSCIVSLYDLMNPSLSLQLHLRLSSILGEVISNLAQRFRSKEL